MRAKLFVLLLCSASWTGNTALWAQVNPPLEKMRFIYSAIGGSQSSVWIPYEAGIFRKHGLISSCFTSVVADGLRKLCSPAKSR
jgi:hypothetical protein